MWGQPQSGSSQVAESANGALTQLSVAFPNSWSEGTGGFSKTTLIWRLEEAAQNSVEPGLGLCILHGESTC